MPSLVKGVGYVTGNVNERGIKELKPLDDSTQTMAMAKDAQVALRKAVTEGIRSPQGVFKGMNPSFVQQYPMFGMESPGANTGMQSLVSDLQSFFKTELNKNFLTTSPLSSGLVPFDLLAP
jgi:hypothetical protein